MEELIVEYINTCCEVKDGISVLFDGEKIYYNELKKHIGDLFDLSDHSVDTYLLSCLSDMNRDFDYCYFITILSPRMVRPKGTLYYMDYEYGNTTSIPPAAYNIRLGEIASVRRRYFAGVDPAMGDEMSINAGHELAHPDSSDDMIYAMSRAIATQTINLDLTQFEDDL